ncbi:MAG: CBS domain-containing protein [Halanaerobiales bacterium]
MQKSASNSRRLINAYNQIDKALRAQYSYNRKISFTDVIRRTMKFNAIVKKHGEKLISYGRLRNAIVHQNNVEVAIAEPNDKVVKEMEAIADLISTPPRALDTIARKNILCVKDTVSVQETIKTMSDSGYTNIPIYNEGVLVGVANGQRIIDKMGEKIANNENIDSFLKNTKISQIESKKSLDHHFSLVDENITLDKAMEMFYDNRKLFILIITKTGNYLEEPLGLITAADIIDINDILDNY